MDPRELKPGNWYWIRRRDGSVIPYRFHKLNPRSEHQPNSGQFFVGSFIQSFSLGRVVGEADLGVGDTTSH